MPDDSMIEAELSPGAQHAREVADRAKRMITDLLARNQALTEEVRAIRIRPLPALGDPGYELWRALMEDLRDEGLIRLSVRAQSMLEVTYESACD